jgi:molybdopterin-guanine dinucleotide biosynthesis protein A
MSMTPPNDPLPPNASPSLPSLPSLVTGLILAGGRGSRMGNIDKGLQAFRGGTMLSHVMARLAPQVGTLIINANQNLARHQQLGVPVWPDALDGFAGPLAGLQTGLMHCDTPYLVTAPCDSPFLPEDLVARLAAALMAQDADVAVAVTLDGQDGSLRRQAQPVFCLVKTSLLPHLSHYLGTGGRKIAAWYATLKVAEALFEDGAAFRNINTLDDLRQFETA